MQRGKKKKQEKKRETEINKNKFATKKETREEHVDFRSNTIYDSRHISNRIVDLK